MRGEIFNPWTEPELVLHQHLAEFLRAPGYHDLLLTWKVASETELLGLLYDIWASCKTSDVPDQVLDVFVYRWNVAMGTEGIEGFAENLEELCVGINTLIETGSLSQEQSRIAQWADGHFKMVGNKGANPGSISIQRGWAELSLVARGAKKLVRCVGEGCERILVIDPKTDTVLYGTAYGYHSEACQEQRGDVSPAVEEPLKQVPVSGVAEDIMGSGLPEES